MTGYAFNTLGLLYELLKDQPAFVTTEPPADITNRLPALIIEADAPAAVSNLIRPGAAANVSFTITALAENDQESFSLCNRAYSALWDSRHEVTRWGWVTHLSEVQAPFLVASAQSAQGIFPYACALDAVIRK